MATSNSRTISAAQYAVLQQNIVSGNRVAYYTKLFEYSGSEAALTMAQISSSSGVVGGIAWALNKDIQRHFPDSYPKGGVEAFSKAIADQDFGMIQADTQSTGLFNVPSDIDMLKGAYSVWVDRKLGRYFPGLLMLSTKELAVGDYKAAAFFAAESKFLSTSVLPILREATGAVVDLPADQGKYLEKCLVENPGATTRIFTAYNLDVTEVIAKDGKSVCVFDKINIKSLIDDMTIKAKGFLSSVDLTETTNGEYVLSWTDMTGSQGRDVYKYINGTTVLDRSDARVLIGNGGTVQASTTFNLDGSFRNKQLMATAANGQVDATLAGRDIVVDLVAAKINLYANTNAVIHGANNTVLVDEAGCYAEISGSNTRVISEVTGTVLGFSGDGQYVTAKNCTVWFQGDADGRVDGAGNTVVANGANVYAEISGSNTTVLSNVRGNVFGLTGDNQTVYTTGATTWFHGGSDGYINGSGNVVVANGADVQTRVHGSDTIVLSEIGGNIFTLNGDRQVIHATNDTVRFESGTDGSIIGSRNSIVAAGGDIQMNIIGDHTYTGAENRGNTFTFTGDGHAIVADGSAVWLNANTSVNLYGRESTFVANGENTVGHVFGDSNIYVSHAKQSSVMMEGRNLKIYGTGIGIELMPGSEATVFGRGNSYAGNNTSYIKFVDEPYLNEWPGSWQMLGKPGMTKPGNYTAPVSSYHSGVQNSFEAPTIGSPPISFVSEPHYFS